MAKLNVSQSKEDYQDVSFSQTINCFSCEAALASLFITCPDNSQHEIIAYCPYCGEESWTIEVCGQWSVIIDNKDIVLSNIISEDLEGTIYSDIFLERV